MNTPGPQGPSRALGDYQVDRAQVYGGQPLQPSATNRPCSFISSVFSQHRSTSIAVLPGIGNGESGIENRGAPRFPAPDSRFPAPHEDWLPTSARGPHPFPFRTRSLSPAAPMVLRLRDRGRVGRRQPFPKEARPPCEGGLLFLNGVNGQRSTGMPLGRRSLPEEQLPLTVDR